MRGATAANPISIHAPLAESDYRRENEGPSFCISIHALLAESDAPRTGLTCGDGQFLSTLSLRRATHYDNYNLHCVEISIHALLAESDQWPGGQHQTGQNFYPRSPCGERQHLDLLGWLRVLISIHALLAESDISSRRSVNN